MLQTFSDGNRLQWVQLRYQNDEFRDGQARNQMV